MVRLSALYSYMKAANRKPEDKSKISIGHQSIRIIS